MVLRGSICEFQEVRGGYSLAFKRHRAHLSYGGALDTLEARFMRQTLCSWEQRFATALLFGFKKFSESMIGRVTKTPGNSHHISAIKGDGASSTAIAVFEPHVLPLHA